MGYDKAIFFALLASLFIGLNTIFIKKSLSRSAPFTVATILTLVGMVFFWLLALVTLPKGIILLSPRANSFFMVAGLFAPAFLRWIFFTSIERVGVSISSSILATIPAFATVIAVICLDEHLSSALAIGVLMIIGGIIVFERDMNGRKLTHRFHAKDLALPLLGALCGAVAITFRKLGLQELNFPVLGAALGFSSAFVAYLCILGLSSKLRKAFTIKPGEIPMFITGGLSLAMGWLCIFFALSHGPVVLVAPLSGLHPLVVLIFSTFLLKDVEHITVKTILGCVSVLLGAIVITIF